MTQIGMYLGWGGKRYDEAKAWLGRDLDFVQLHGGLGGWDDWKSSLPGNIRDWRKKNVRLHLSQPLFAEGGRLDAAGRGEYNGEFKRLAEAVTSALAGYQGDVPIRFGVEYNATSWMRWRLGLTGNAQDYASAWRHIVNAFRAQPGGERFKPILCPNFGEQNPVPAWPGREFVDYLGMDFYDDPRFDPNAAATFRRQKGHAYGLDMLLEWAAKEGIPASFDEFGCRGTSPERAAEYVRLCGDYFRANSAQIAHVSYFNEDDKGDFPNKVELDEARPAARAAFKAAMPWGTGNVDPAPAPAPAPVLVPVPKPAPTPEPAKLTAAETVIDQSNAAFWRLTSTNAVPEPHLSLLRKWEGWCFWPVVKAGGKPGFTMDPTKEGDAGAVASMLLVDIYAQRDTLPPNARAVADGVVTLLKPLAPNVAEPAPTPAPEPDNGPAPQPDPVPPVPAPVPAPVEVRVLSVREDASGRYVMLTGPKDGKAVFLSWAG